jgi:hypothetical protein
MPQAPHLEARSEAGEKRPVLAEIRQHVLVVGVVERLFGSKRHFALRLRESRKVTLVFEQSLNIGPARVSAASQPSIHDTRLQGQGSCRARGRTCAVGRRSMLQRCKITSSPALFFAHTHTHTHTRTRTRTYAVQHESLHSMLENKTSQSWSGGPCRRKHTEKKSKRDIEGCPRIDLGHRRALGRPVSR